jgi:Xaa-Pro dipeptidase
MYQQRLERLQAELRRRSIDCLALIAGANLRYMTGLDFHLMERPTTVFFPKEGKPVFAVPTLEVPRVEKAVREGGLFEGEVYSYNDTDGPDEAYSRAIMALPEVQKYAVEYLRMRILELKLVQRHVPAAAMEDAGPVMDTLRLTKDAKEVAAMRRAIEISEEALHSTIHALEPGMTEHEIANQLAIAQIERGGGIQPFEPIVLIGDNAALPHGSPSERELQPGQEILFDFGTSYDGYISDITRTFFFGGEPSAKQREIYEVVKAANAAGRAAAKPGVPCQDVDRAARKVIDDAGYGEYFIHRVGHGIGMEGHEGPYMREGNDLPLEVGMTFTVEPGIYIPGEIGVRIEDNLVVTEDGAESLTTFSRDLAVVGSVKGG